MLHKIYRCSTSGTTTTFTIDLEDRTKSVDDEYSRLVDAN